MVVPAPLSVLERTAAGPQPRRPQEFCGESGPVSGTQTGLAAVLSPRWVTVPDAVLARRLGWASRTTVLVPFMFPLFLYAVLNSTFVTLRQGSIRWRETFYPLEPLRARNVR